MKLLNYKVFFTLLLLSMVIGAKAQNVETRVKSVQIEALGASVMGGISYDSRFNGTTGLGFRVGVAFSARTTLAVSGNTGYDANGITAPIEINYLHPFAHYHFGELALGVNPGMYKLKDVAKLTLPGGEPYKLRPSKTVFAYNNFVNIGYRYQRPKGFGFRGGISVAFDFGAKNAYGMYPVWPYLGIGYSF